MSLTAIFGTALLSIVLSILAGVVIWGRCFTNQPILFWDMLNLPAAVAVAAVVGGLVTTGFGADD